jgi:hypothetical protein
MSRLFHPDLHGVRQIWDPPQGLRIAFAVTVFSDDAIHEAALSVRVSQNEQQESIDDQLRECRKFCRRHDFSAHPLEISA